MEDITRLKFVINALYLNYRLSFSGFASILVFFNGPGIVIDF